MTRQINFISSVREKNYAEALLSLSYVCVCLFMFEASVTGLGTWLHVGFLTPRLALVALAGLFALPAMIRDFGRLIKNPFCILALVLVAYVVVATARGYAAGNTRAIIVADLETWAWLILVPIFIESVNSRARFVGLFACMAAGAVLLSLAVLALNVAVTRVPGFYLYALTYGVHLGLGFLDQVSPTLYRLIPTSALYLIAACVFFTASQGGRDKPSLIYAAGAALCLSALLLSFTRSLYAAAAIAAFVTLLGVVVGMRAKLKVVLVYLCMTVLMFAVIVGAQSLLLGGRYVAFALSRTLGVDFVHDKEAAAASPTDEGDERAYTTSEYIQISGTSDTFRAKVIAEAEASIAKAPRFRQRAGVCIGIPARSGQSDGVFLSGYPL